MAASPRQLSDAQAHLARLAANDLAVIWRRVSNAVDARIALQQVLPDLVATYGQAASSIAADFYDEARDAAKMAGTFTALPASIEDNATDALALWATSTGTSMDDIRTLVEGGLERRIYNWGRQTIMGSSLADPRADGWQRVGAGSCDFCEMLISRGAVYTEATADFASHDHCYCQAMPAFHGEPRDVKPFKPSLRRSTADQHRAREWIAANL